MRTDLAVEVVQNILFADADIIAEVGNNMHYARGPVTTDWPQVIFFPVAERDTYIIDYNKVTMQVSSWSHEKYQSLKIHNILRKLFREFRGVVTTHYGDVEINWTQLVDTSALPQDDPQLFGHQLRFELRTRGQNIGGL